MPAIDKHLQKNLFLATSFTLVSSALWANSSIFSQWRFSIALPLHSLLETCTIVIFSSVFIVCWNAFGAIRKLSSVILATSFLCAALFGFVHAISFQEMPGVISTNHLHISLSAWLLSRGFISLSLLGLLFSRPDPEITEPQSRIILLGGLSLTSLIICLIFISPSTIPATYQPSIGQTSFKLIGEAILICINLITALVLLTRAIRSEHNDLTALTIKNASLFLAALLMAESEVFFTLYSYNDEFFVIVGHVYQLIAAIAIYRSMVAVNIQTPYMKLAKSTENLVNSANELAIQKERLSRMIDTAIDGIITIDENQTILLVNPSAAAMFGYRVEQLVGQSIDLVIPLRHRGNHAEHVKSFGATGSTRRKMGASFEDFYVTGLHHNGQEFPIEASISSQIENGSRFYTVIFRDITERKLAKEQMAAYHDELSQLSAALQTIREEERKHIARELHDDLGQLLAALRMDLSLLQRDQQLTDKPAKIVASMDNLILTAINSLRRIASDLRPRALDEGGLYFALLTLTKEFSARHQISCDFNAEEQQLSLDDEHSTAIFRVIQESLTNVARHALATEVVIRFERSSENLEFSIEDNGRGFSNEDLKKNRSFGLVGIRERIKALRGEFEISSQPGCGTTLKFKLPVSSAIPY